MFPITHRRGRNLSTIATDYCKMSVKNKYVLYDNVNFYGLKRFDLKYLVFSWVLPHIELELV